LRKLWYESILCEARAWEDQGFLFLFKIKIKGHKAQKKKSEAAGAKGGASPSCFDWRHDTSSSASASFQYAS